MGDCETQKSLSVKTDVTKSIRTVFLVERNEIKEVVQNIPGKDANDIPLSQKAQEQFKLVFFNCEEKENRKENFIEQSIYSQIARNLEMEKEISFYMNSYTNFDSSFQSGNLQLIQSRLQEKQNEMFNLKKELQNLERLNEENSDYEILNRLEILKKEKEEIQVVQNVLINQLSQKAEILKRKNLQIEKLKKQNESLKENLEKISHDQTDSISLISQEEKSLDLKLKEQERIIEQNKQNLNEILQKNDEFKLKLDKIINDSQIFQNNQQECLDNLLSHDVTILSLHNDLHIEEYRNSEYTMESFMIKNVKYQNPKNTKSKTEEKQKVKEVAEIIKPRRLQSKIDNRDKKETKFQSSYRNVDLPIYIKKGNGENNENDYSYEVKYQTEKKIYLNNDYDNNFKNMQNYFIKNKDKVLINKIENKDSEDVKLKHFLKININNKLNFNKDSVFDKFDEIETKKFETFRQIDNN